VFHYTKHNQSIDRLTSLFFELVTKMPLGGDEMQDLQGLLMNYRYLDQRDEVFFLLKNPISFKNAIRELFDPPKVINDIRRLIFVGLGGANFNVLTGFLIFGLQLTQFPNLEQIIIYEADNLSANNMIRLWSIVPPDPIKFALGYNKIDYWFECTIRYFKPLEEVLDQIDLVAQYRWFEEKDEALVDDQTLLIGAPDVKTRQRWVQKGLPHIFIGTFEDTAYVERLTSVSDMALDLYGYIPVPQFIATMISIGSALGAFIDELKRTGTLQEEFNMLEFYEGLKLAIYANQTSKLQEVVKNG